MHQLNLYAVCMLLFGSRYSKMDQVKFVEEFFLKAVFHKFNWSILEYLDPFHTLFPKKLIYYIIPFISMLPFASMFSIILQTPKLSSYRHQPTDLSSKSIDWFLHCRILKNNEMKGLHKLRLYLALPVIIILTLLPCFCT